MPACRGLSRTIVWRSIHTNYTLPAMVKVHLNKGGLPGHVLCLIDISLRLSAPPTTVDSVCQTPCCACLHTANPQSPRPLLHSPTSPTPLPRTHAHNSPMPTSQISSVHSTATTCPPEPSTVMNRRMYSTLDTGLLGHTTLGTSSRIRCEDTAGGGGASKWVQTVHNSLVSGATCMLPCMLVNLHDLLQVTAGDDTTAPATCQCSINA